MNKKIQERIITISSLVLALILVVWTGAIVLEKMSIDIPDYCCEEMNGTLEMTECNLTTTFGKDMCGTYCHLPNGTTLNRSQLMCITEMIS